MAIENFNEDVEVIQKLDTLPNQEGGLSAEELKAKFDQAAIAIKNFINNSLLPVVRELEDAKDPSIIYGLDQTLSELGRAADAKAVGDALAGKVGTKDIIGIACGGTGADNAEAARRNLDAAQAEHTHSASDMKTGLLPLERGGTGAGTAAQAMENLGITAALAGKAPAVYTYPSVHGIDANNIVDDFHKYVINCANNPYSHGFLDVVKASAEGFTPNGAQPIIRQTMREWSTGNTAYRTSVDNGATWSNWVKEYSASNKPTPAEIGAAPSGYGLGEYSAKLVDWGIIDSVTKPGWYRFASGITIGSAWEVAVPYMRVDAWDANSCVQTLYSASAPMRKLVRVRSGGVWQDWEFEAVPGYPGYEARLTERWNSKPVYWKLISMGKLASAGSAIIKAHGISSTNFISCRGIIIDGNGTAHEIGGGNTLASCYVESGNVKIHSQESLTGYTGYVELKYTK